LAWDEILLLKKGPKTLVLLVGPVVQSAQTHREYQETLSNLGPKRLVLMGEPAFVLGQAADARASLSNLGPFRGALLRRHFTKERLTYARFAGQSD
jgi:hypothetical protein